ncbi:hypothetical protein K505DRAFT_323401 [Melanomma pulvis-pyrius CBS 109.77]|uniref:Uncharacterized protein n=1 Tax=Melanomma pulvis-pyrius CBS 109.77 TaxID=1314802 RepID=A0A6A6XIS3_9PLEO|nr:hypothetical protein K505DRAFT_323401 [Melanomma pulvis-pyrius CBS 109.77]
MCPAIQLDMSKDYTKPPKAHHAADITTAIYQGETCNPLVCLAIIRVAQANLPFINFSSALNHLTNLSPADPFPQLPKEPTFVDDIAHMPRAGDKIIKTLFIPGYYTDGRHALGYYVRLTKYKTSILFTPCTEANLQQLGLVATFEGDTGAWEDAVIATNKGTWKDKEDESFSWTILFNWVAVCWKDRLRLIMGGKESPW